MTLEAAPTDGVTGELVWLPTALSGREPEDTGKLGKRVEHLRGRGELGDVENENRMVYKGFSVKRPTATTPLSTWRVNVPREQVREHSGKGQPLTTELGPKRAFLKN